MKFLLGLTISAFLVSCGNVSKHDQKVTKTDSVKVDTSMSVKDTLKQKVDSVKTDSMKGLK